MKAAITTLNGRTNLDKANIRSIDISACRTLVMQRQNYEQVDFVNIQKKRLGLDDPENQPFFKNFESTSLNEYDHVYVYNYTANFFGGAIQPHVVKQLKEIGRHTGGLFYIQTDPELHLVNLASVIHNALKRGRKLSFKNDDRLTLDDVEIHSKKPWTLLYNGQNVKDYLRRYESKIKAQDRYPIINYEYVDFFERLYASLKSLPVRNRGLHEREFDLVYYGNWRPERAKLFKNYFIGNSLKNYFIGLKPSHLQKYTVHDSTFKEYVDHSLLGDEINKAIASIVIGDPTHGVTQIKTARFFENIKARVVSFIDLGYDPNRTLYVNEKLRESLYVKSITEVKDKLNKIKANPAMYSTILDLQEAELKRYSL